MSRSPRGVRLDRGASCAVLMAAFFALLLSPGRAADRWDRAKAEQQLEGARAARTAAESAEEPSRDLYLKAVRLYRQVYRSDPHFGGADDAIFEAGVVAQSAAERFGNLEDYKRAALQFEYLVSDYQKSAYCPEAWLRLGDLKAGPLQDESGALAAYDTLKARFPRSKAAREFLARSSARPPARMAEDTTPAPVPVKPPQEPTPPVPVSVVPPSPPASNGSRTTIRSIRHWSTDDYTRVVIDMDHETAWRKTLLSTPDRLFFDITNSRASRELQNKIFPVGDEFLRQVRVGQNQLDVVRVVLDFEHIADHTVFELHDPYRLVIDIHGTRRNSSQRAIAASPFTPRPDEVGPPGVQRPEPMAATRKPGPPPSPGASAPPSPLPRTSPTAGVASVPVSPAKPPGNAAAAPDSGKRTESAKPESSQRVTDAAANAVAVSPSVPSAPAAKPSAASEVPKTPPTTVPTPPNLLPSPKVAETTSTGSRTLTRMLGLKIGRIVIDPGHGGHDTGTVGKGGLLEKDLVLGIAHEVRRLLEEGLGAEVVMTRENDRFVPLEERTAIANQKRADLFVSIHANSSSSRSISGVETYYLDFARTEAARGVAARENATSVRNISELETLIKQIVQADKSTESREFASKVQRKLYTGVRPLFPAARNRGVRSAPFVVLIGANMPSILAEIAFISNPRDERTLKDDDNRGRLAQALFSGIQDYMRSLGTEVAQNRGQ